MQTHLLTYSHTPNIEMLSHLKSAIYSAANAEQKVKNYPLSSYMCLKDCISGGSYVMCGCDVKKRLKLTSYYDHLYPLFKI